MAKTLLDLDRELLAAAKEILGQPTLTATVTEALRQVVADRAWTGFVDSLAAMDDDQVEALREARNQW